MARCNAATSATWKGQLNFEMPCGYTVPEDRCWLIEDLAPWNRVLNGFAYDLVEVAPGKLRLRYVPDDVVTTHSANTCKERDSLISWLLEHHRCINELHVLCTDSTPVRPPARVRLESSQEKNNNRSVRCLEVTVSEGCHHKMYLPSFTYNLRGVEQLKIRPCYAIHESVLLWMLERNSKSLRSVELIRSELSLCMADALLCIDKCEFLNISAVPVIDGNHTATAAMTRLVRRRSSVKNLRVCLIFPELPCNISALGAALKANVSLTTLLLQIVGCRSSPRDLFAALEVNATLKTLNIYCCSYDESCGQALALALSKNTSLVSLNLDGRVPSQCMTSIAEALSLNATLEELLFPSAALNVDGVIALCAALRTNKTVKKLGFPAFTVSHASHAERTALAEKITSGGGYGRVMLPLADADLLPLSTILTCPTSSPEELCLSYISDFSCASAKLLLGALASGSHVRTFSVDIANSANPAVLCSVLRVNRSIRTLRIYCTQHQQQCVKELLNALEFNKTINQLAITSFDPEAKLVSLLSDFFVNNRTITSLWLDMEGRPLYCRLNVLELARGLFVSPVIVELKLQRDQNPTDDRIRYLISEMLRRNRSVLNRAVDFVVLACNDKRCAEAFEFFSGKACLLAQVIKTAGLTEREAQLAIASTKNFLLDNYLAITGIVRRSVVCHPGDGGTQCDQLSADCWRAVVRHLMISDVLG